MFDHAKRDQLPKGNNGIQCRLRKRLGRLEPSRIQMMLEAPEAALGVNQAMRWLRLLCPAPKAEGISRVSRDLLIVLRDVTYSLALLGNFVRFAHSASLVFSLRLFFPSFVVKGALCPLRQSTPLKSIIRGAKTHLIRATHTRRGGWAVSLYALLFQR